MQFVPEWRRKLRATERQKGTERLDRRKAQKGTFWGDLAKKIGERRGGSTGGLIMGVWSVPSLQRKLYIINKL